jgi:hypothetical protein
MADSPEKKHSAYRVPSKIPVPTKVAKNEEKQGYIVNEFKRSPRPIKREKNEGEISPAVSFQKNALSQPASRNKKKSTYLQSLKHKFSPISEDSSGQVKAKIINPSDMSLKTRAKQPSQNNKFSRKKWKEDPYDGNFVKSTEQSKKNILKVASTLKKKLKHNFSQKQGDSEDEVYVPQNLIASAQRAQRPQRPFTSISQYEGEIEARKNFATPNIYKRFV